MIAATDENCGQAIFGSLCDVIEFPGKRGSTERGRGRVEERGKRAECKTNRFYTDSRRFEYCDER